MYLAPGTSEITQTIDFIYATSNAATLERRKAQLLDLQERQERIERELSMKPMSSLVADGESVAQKIVAALPKFEETLDGVGFEKLQDMAKRFDFDLVALVSYEQTMYEFQNMRSLGLITMIGKDFYKVDVDQALTVIELALIEPESRAVVMRVAAGDKFGDTTTLLDDWRSQTHVRKVSFDRADDVFVEALRAELPKLRERVTLPSED